MGTFDGPGLRLVVFLQGCNFRCLYCANPDTIEAGAGTLTDPAEILRMAVDQKPFFGRRGGVTFSGGEPTFQAAELVPLVKSLKEAGIHVCIDSNGGVWNPAVEELLGLVDLVLLDVMMPKLDGFEVCRELRRRSMVPIIMVTARGEDFERIMGLDIGADDYILKPFSAGEVMARVRAILRRVQPREAEQQNLYSVGNLVIDLDKYLVTIGGADVTLTKKEVELLWTLAKNSSKVFSRENLLDSIWGYDYFGDSRTVDSHIKRLRAKVDKFEHEEWEIKTIWGVGYRFEEKEHAQ